MKIKIENSTWNNVGDGWYQFVIYQLIKNLYPTADVFMGEGPIRRAFRIHKKQQLENALNAMEYETADLHIFSGPMLPSIISDYSKTIKKIKDRGDTYALISVSGTGLSRGRIEEIGSFLTQYPPLFMSTRDEETYNVFSPYVKNVYNGICTAFLVDRVLKLDSIQLDKPFFISSFYTELEPTFSIPDSKDFSIENLCVKRHKTILGMKYDYARHLNFLRKQQVEVNGHRIVRTIQNLNTRFNHINFAMPNSFISFNPVKYLELVKASEFTVSDRVHACVVSLACNHPARFLYETPRAGLFSRMGLDYKANNGIMYPNMDKVDEELDLLSGMIKKYI